MKLNLFIQNDCPHCEELLVPTELDINVINVDEDYDGFRPESLPVLQADRVNYPGGQIIEAVFKLLVKAQDGEFKK